MPVRRALVDCAVLSLQDQCLFYPCCKACFSKIDVQQQDTARVRCFQCGTSSLREQVDHRYRLALRVAHDGHIFGVTVFGGCLNPVFGIHASGLQRLLEDSEEPSGAQTRLALLIQAVEDCLIGRHFIFGIKVPRAENGPLFGGPQGGPTLNGSSSKEPVQFIASQITLPKATAQVGCSVISYYRTLLQKAAEAPLGCTGPRTAIRPLAPPHQSPLGSFDTTLPGSCLLSQSPSRSAHHDHTLIPTPPWQQSLGLITSSAEQEEGCSTQRSGGELACRQPASQRSPHHIAVWQRDSWEDRDGDTEQRVSSTPQSLYEHRSRNGRPLTASPASPIHHQADANTPVPHTWSSPSQPGPSGTVPLGPGVRWVSHGEQDVEENNYNNTSLSGSMAWEDMPFSESLTEFLCKENEKLDRINEMEPMLIAPYGRESTADNASLGNSSYTKKSSTETVARRHSNAPSLDAHSRGRILLDITNTAALSYGGDFTSNSVNQTCEDVDWNVSQTGNVRPPEWEPEEEEGGIGSSTRKRVGDEEEEEQIGLCDGEGVYDCSMDLFDGSPMTSANTQTPDTNTEAHAQMADAHTETQALIPDMDSDAEAHPTQPRPNTQDLKDRQTDASDMDLRDYSGIQVQHSYLPDTQDLNSNKDTALAQNEHSHLRDTECLNNSKKAATDTDQCECSLSLDFIPSSQSTPLITRAAPIELLDPAQRTRILGELESRPGCPHVSHLTPTGRGSDNPIETVSLFCNSNKLCTDSRHPFTGRCAARTQASSTTTPSRRLAPKRGPKRTFWKLEQEPKRILAAQHRMRIQKRRALSRGSTRRRANHEGDRSLCDTSVCDESVCGRNVCDVSVCNDKDNEVMVPPTTDRTRRPVKLRQRGQTDDCAKDLTSTQVNCKRTLLYRTTTPQRPQTGLVHHRQTGDVVCTQPGDGERTGSCSKMSGDEVSDYGAVSSALHDDSEACDWSRDLFSDSF